MSTARSSSPLSGFTSYETQEGSSRGSVSNALKKPAKAGGPAENGDNEGGGRTAAAAGVTTPAARGSARPAAAAQSLADRSYRLHYEFAEETLLAKAHTLERFCSFFFYVVFVIGFCFYFLLDLDVPAGYQLRHTLLDTLARTENTQLKSDSYFSDVGNANRYGGYIVHVVAPLLADVFSPIGSSFPVGAMRIRTQRSKPTGCDGMQYSDMGALYSADMCADSSVASEEDTNLVLFTRFNKETMWTYKTCAQLGGSDWIRSHGFISMYHCGGFLFDVPLWVLRGNASASSVSSPETNATAQNATPSLGTAEQAFPFTDGTIAYQRISLAELQHDYLRQLFWGASVPFLDDYATRVAVTEVLFYCPPLQRFATVKLVGERTGSASWKTTALFRTARVWTRDDVGKTVYDAVVLLLVVVWIVSFCYHSVISVQQRVAQQVGTSHRSNRRSSGGERGIDSSGLSHSTSATLRFLAVTDFLFDPSTLLTVAILGLLVVSGAFRIAAIVYAARNVPTLDKLTFMDGYPMQLEYLFFSNRVQLYINAVVALLLFYRLLLFVTLDTHAMRAMQVLARAQSTLCGFVLVSLLFITTFALTLTTLYGNSVWVFRNVDSSFSTLLRVIMRQQDINSLTRDVDDPTRIAFLLFAFNITSVMAIFSLCTGILVHMFTEVRKEESAPSTAAYQTGWLLGRVKTCVCTPRRWLWYMWRWCTGHGDAALLRHAACCLHRYRMAKYPVLEHANSELHHLLRQDDFEEAMRYGDESGDADGGTLSSLSWRSSMDTSGERRRRTGIWMTWTTSSSLQTDDASPGGSSGGRVGSDGRHKAVTPLSGAHTTQESTAAAISSRSSSSTTRSRGSSPSEPVKRGSVRSAADEERREQTRRRWLRRWGGYTPAEVWADLLRDWKASTTSDASLEYKEELLWLRYGVQSAVGNKLAHVKEFPQRLAELERKLALLESHLIESELADGGAADKSEKEE